MTHPEELMAAIDALCDAAEKRVHARRALTYQHTGVVAVAQDKAACDAAQAAYERVVRMVYGLEIPR